MVKELKLCLRATIKNLFYIAPSLAIACQLLNFQLSFRLAGVMVLTMFFAVIFKWFWCEWVSW